MSQPTPRQGHVDAALTDHSEAFLQDENKFVAGKVFPLVPVEHSSDKYYTYPREYWMRSDVKARAPGDESAGSGFVREQKDYTTQDYGLHTNVPDQTRRNSDAAVRPDEEATEFLSRQMLMHREKGWNSNFFVPGQWGTDITPGLLWDAVGSSPLDDVEDGMLDGESTTGMEFNTIVIGKRVWKTLKQHPQFKEIIKHTSSDPVTTALLARHWEVDRVLIAGAVEATSEEGAAVPTFDFVHGNHLLALHVAKTPGLMTPSAGYTFGWAGVEGSNPLGTAISRYRMNTRKADRLEIDASYEQKLVAPDLGVLFTNVIS